MSDEHVCICGREMSDHDAVCYEPECDGVQHWPPLCCRECPCRSYQEAHPMLRILQAAEDDDLSFHQRGTQFRLKWWTSEYEYRTLSRSERALVLQALSDGLLYKTYPIGLYNGKGSLDLTRDGLRRLNKVYDGTSR